MCSFREGVVVKSAAGLGSVVNVGLDEVPLSLAIPPSACKYDFHFHGGECKLSTDFRPKDSQAIGITYMSKRLSSSE
jgi:hypothetical protein